MKQLLAVWLLAVPCAAAHAQERIGLLPHGELDVPGVTAAAVAPAGDFVVVGTRAGKVQIYGTERSELRHTLGVDGGVRAVVVDANGSTVYVATDRKELLSFEAASGRPIARIQLSAAPTTLDVASDRRTVVVGMTDGTVGLYTDKLQLIRKLVAPDFYKKSVEFVAVGQGNNEIFGATTAGASAYWPQGAEEPARTSSPNRREFVAGARDFTGDMLALGVKTIELIRERGNMAAEASYTVQVIDWKTGRQIAEIKVGVPELRALAVAPARTTVASIDVNGELTLWDVQRRTRVLTMRATDEPLALSFSGDGRWLASASSRGKVELWRAEGLAGSGLVAGESIEGLYRGKYGVTPSAEPLYASRERLRIAVLGLRNLGVDSVTAQSVDNILTSQASGYAHLTVLERDAMDRVLKEVRFQNSGITTDQGAAQIGKQLNASKVLVGSVNKLGTTIVITVRLVDVQTGQAEGYREVRCNDCKLEDLPDAIQLLTRALFGK